MLMDSGTAHHKVVDEHLLTLNARRASLLSVAMSARLSRSDKSVEVSEIFSVGSSCDIELEKAKSERTRQCTEDAVGEDTRAVIALAFLVRTVLGLDSHCLARRRMVRIEMRN